MDFYVVTFHKCASNWTRRLFRDIADVQSMNIWVDEPNQSEINTPTDRGATNTMRIFRSGSYQNFMTLGSQNTPVVLCVRDPKDTLVSQYWSWMVTHKNNSDRVHDVRRQLKELDDIKKGLLLLIRTDSLSFARNVRDWLREDKAKILFLRYEELLSDFSKSFSVALRHLGLAADHAYLAELESKYSFKALSKRDRGAENRNSHYRKGVPGDWTNCFSEEVAAEFDEHYGDVCDALGYQRAAGLSCSSAQLAGPLSGSV